MRLYYLAWWTLSIAAAVSGCSSDTASPSFLEVLETAPVDGDSTVQLEVVLGVRFDAEIDPATLTRDTFRLFVADGGQIEGEVRLGSRADIAVFAPDEPLTIITNYEATVTTAVLDVTGRALEKDFTWRFRTIDDDWGIAEDLSRNTDSDAQSPRIGADSSSNAIAVWLESDGVRDNAMASRFTRVELWSEPEPIETADEAAEDLQLAVAPRGDAIAVWRQRHEEGDRIWANRFTNEGGWEAAVNIEADATVAGNSATTPSVAIDSNGNAIALWYQSDLVASGFNVWSNRYVVGEGWSAAEKVENEPPSFRQPDIAVGFDAAGNAVAIWSREGLLEDDVWGNRYTVDEGWGTAQLVETSDTGGVRDLALAVTPGGDAHALWSQFDEGGVRSLWTNVYSAGDWGAASLFDEEEVNDAESPQIAAGPAGVLHAVWSQSDGRLTNIWANRYTPESEWGSPELIEGPLDPEDDGDAKAPQLSVDAEGNVFAVWQQLESTGFSVWSNRYTPDDGWFEAETLETDLGAATRPQVATAPERRAHAVWQQILDGRTVIRTNRFE